MRQHSQIDKVIEKESRRRAQDPAPILPQKQSPRNLPSAEIALLEQPSVLHAPPGQHDQYRQENRDTVHGVKSDRQVTPAANQAHQVDESANWTAGRSHECRDEDLDRAAFCVEVLI
jgi:hypothetical protein